MLNDDALEHGKAGALSSGILQRGGKSKQGMVIFSAGIADDRRATLQWN